MSGEDDWFERALRDLDGESDRSTDGDLDDGEVGDDLDDDTGDVTGENGGGDESDPFGGVRSETGSTDPGDRDAEPDENDSIGDGSSGDDDGASGGEFATDVAEAFGVGDRDSIEPDGDSFSEPEGDPFSEADGDPFGDSGGEDDPFGDGTFDDDDSGGGSDAFGGGTFGDDDPFGGYRGTAPSRSDDFGFGEFGGDTGGESTGFDVDPDEFDSSIERTDIGIEGLDDMILGGVPRRSLLSVIGGAGTGKTTFALQFLNETLESGGKGIYITLEQTRESILSTASEKGWSFREHAEEDRLAVVAIDPIEMANSLASIRNDLTRLIAEFDADRLVLDSVSLLEMMYDHPAKRRSEVFGFTRSLKEAGVTTLLTSEASEENPYASRHGIVEYLTDAVFVLQYVRGSDFRETRLAVEIQKIRDANHSRETKPYEITDTGISVYGQANIF
jgi:KaiC domain protein